MFNLLTHLIIILILGALVDAISEGLATADALQLTGIAIAVPIHNSLLTALPDTLVRTLTVEATVSSLRNASHLNFIKKVVCLDLADAGSSSTPSVTGYPGFRSGRDSANTVNSEVSQSTEVLLHPACDNRMAMTMLLLLEQESLARQNSSRMILPMLRMIVCNIPLPCNLSAEILCPSILQAQQQQRRGSIYSNLGFGGSYGGFDSSSLHSIGDISAQYEEQETIVLRGLPIGILRAIRAIKSLVASSSASY